MHLRDTQRVVVVEQEQNQRMAQQTVALGNYFLTSHLMARADTLVVEVVGLYTRLAVLGLVILMELVELVVEEMLLFPAHPELRVWLALPILVEVGVDQSGQEA
tara:strand:+ start:305 stop:616 length:312 start_codon:yes stop_codon:yes gene_type:complete